MSNNIGARDDSAATNTTDSWSVISILKGIFKSLFSNNSLIIASNGVFLPVASLTQTLGYTTGKLTTVTVEYNSVTYIQTLTYTGENLTSISEWVAQ